VMDTLPALDPETTAETAERRRRRLRRRRPDPVHAA
jgi:hypothetical protein